MYDSNKKQLHLMNGKIKPGRCKRRLIPVMLLLTGLLVLSSAGCISKVKGEFYLTNNNYAQGIDDFKKEIEEKPENADNYYYMGRFLLAEKNYPSANTYFLKAVKRLPQNSKYHFWLGISYGALKKTKHEQSAYQTAIRINPEYYQAHTYLGHTLFRKKKYKAALKSYSTALSIRENNPSAMYNRALVLFKLNKKAESEQGFKAYMKRYPFSPRARFAASYLNQLGNFEYRPHLMGRRKIVFKQIKFAPDSTQMEADSRLVVRQIGDILKTNPDYMLHLMSYKKGNARLARKRALAVKSYLTGFFLTVKPGQIRLSWFDTPEITGKGRHRHSREESIHFFIPPVQKNK